MNQSVMLYGWGPKDILKASVENKASACMSYLLRGKWRSAKILLSGIGANVLSIEVAAGKKSRPVHIQTDQVVSLLLEYRHMKFVFDTHVLWVVPSLSPSDSSVMVLAIPNQIKLVERRTYSRVAVPENLCVHVRAWHHHHVKNNGHVSPEHHWKCRLVDMSPRGAQIAFCVSQRPDFKMGEKIGMQFTPMAHEMPLILDAKVRNSVPTANERQICLGLEFVGLETSFEGRQVLQRLYRLVEWYDLNQCEIKQSDVLTSI